MRREQPVTIAADGRDKGKRFVIMEMPAAQAEWWAVRALLAIAKVDDTVDPDIWAMGWAGLAMVGARGLMKIRPDEAKPLLDEMRGCIRTVEPKIEGGTRPVTDDDIEEVGTWFLLREEVANLHLGFSLREEISRLVARAQATRAPAKRSTSRRPSPP